MNDIPTSQDPGGTGSAESTPLLSLQGISKSFAGIRVVDGVNLDVKPGTVHAIVGENGAGKSTLCRMIAGLLRPDVGEISFDGNPVEFQGPAAARQTGISFVPQELSIVPEMSLAENIVMGKLPARAGVVDRARLRRECRQVLERLALDLDPLAPVGSLPPGVQQLVMVARGLSIDAKLFILDEPTAALTDSEVDHLFGVIEATKRSGCAFLYISHRLQELERIADEITVLRDGKLVFTKPAGSMGRDEIIQAMVGRRIERLFEQAHAADDAGTTRAGTASEPSGKPPALSVRGLSGGRLHDISFTVDSGSIVGIAGLLGAGRTEILRCLFGVDPKRSGEIALDGRPVVVNSPREAIRHGIVLVPEERKSEGLVLGLSVAENLAAPHLRRFSSRSWVSNRKIRASAVEVANRLGIKAKNVDVPVGQLSGGNQQKVVLGRWMLTHGHVYLLDEPTRGVDVGAKADIYAAIRELTLAGRAVVVVSSELPELIGLCDRILVMREGRLVADVPSAECSEERILAAAMGHEASVAAEEERRAERFH